MAQQKLKRKLTFNGWFGASLNFLGFRLLPNLQPLKYMLHEQPKEKDAPHVLGLRPWQVQVRLEGGEQCVRQGHRIPEPGMDYEKVITITIALDSSLKHTLAASSLKCTI